MHEVKKVNEEKGADRLEQIGMGTCVQHQQSQLAVILLPNQQPIRLNVTLPCVVITKTFQFVRMILLRQFSNCA